MTVTINGKPVELNNNYKPILVDIFNAIDFNLSDKKGFLMLKVNGAPAGYTTPLKDGDVIEIYWDN
jgi:sulfur carrier protein ThiS